MNLKHITSAICLGATLVSTAGNWTLDSCITYAVEHNLTVKSRQIEIKSGELDVTAAKDK